MNIRIQRSSDLHSRIERHAKGSRQLGQFGDRSVIGRERQVELGRSRMRIHVDAQADGSRTEVQVELGNFYDVRIQIVADIEVGLDRITDLNSLDANIVQFKFAGRVHVT